MERQLDDAREELKATKRQKIRELLKRPESETLIEETYAELEAELESRIDGLKNQITLTANRRNTIIRVNRTARTAVDIFNDILNKDKLDKLDLELIIEKILIYEDHLEIRLKSDIDELFSLNSEEDTVNFPPDAEGISQTCVVQASTHRPDKVFRVNVISSGDPLEIYTDKDGEVIFKKYSPMGELSSFATQICDTLAKTSGFMAAVADRDAVIAVSGAARRELMDKRLSEELEHVMESRQVYQYKPGDARVSICDGLDKHFVGVAAPIIAEGDVSGCVLFVAGDGAPPMGDTEYKLVQTVAGFLGKQMES